MWAFWQDALKNDTARERRREARRRKKKEKSERKILRLERKLTLKSKLEEELRVEDERRRNELEAVTEDEEMASVSEFDPRDRRRKSAKVNFLTKLFKGQVQQTTTGSASIVSSKPSTGRSSGGHDDINDFDEQRLSTEEDHREGEEETV